MVPVTATANAGYQFSNWSGACSGTGACTVTMDTDKQVTAVFTPITVAMTNNQIVSNLSGSTNSQRFFSIDVPSGASSLMIKISGGTGDADLYTRLGSLPTLSSFDCSPYATGNNESCTYTNPPAGKYYIMLNAFNTYSGVSLQAGYTVPTVAQSLQFGAASYSVSEAGASITIPVTRTGSSTGSVSVQYGTTNGTATAGSDYTTKTGTLSFASGVTTQNIVIAINNDSLLEISETFLLSLSNPVGAVLGTNKNAAVTILDDDNEINFAVTSATVLENAGNVVLTVTRTGNVSKTASIKFATANGTAVAKSDYTRGSGTLSWAAGNSSSKTITIPIINDTVKESLENFTVTLSSPTGATQGTNKTITVQIQDND